MTAAPPRRNVAAMTTTLHSIRDERLAAALSLLITAGALAYANFAAGGDNGGTGAYAITVGVCAVLAAVLFGRVLPNASDHARAAWIRGSRAGRGAPAALGVLGVLAVVGCVIG